ncbi:MAG: internalization-related competence protein ComEC/Rec2 protein [Parcubacteria group bacterium GW2011_GWA2_50_10]|nr:MAG: internalization-related competence protein ComEC/Rec2 protein [Parcubacteria group bacterium GW2011_GWA2_50_10]
MQGKAHNGERRKDRDQEKRRRNPSCHEGIVSRLRNRDVQDSSPFRSVNIIIVNKKQPCHAGDGVALCYNTPMEKWRVRAIGLLFALGVANWSLWGYALAGNTLRVTFLDVGQGDAILVETPQGHQILIDGGPDSKVLEKLGKQMPFWDKTIDLVVLTHPEADHITGLVAVFEQYNVKSVLWTGVGHKSNIFAAWERALEKEDARIMLARAGQKVVWSQNFANGSMEILYPDDSAIATARAVNDTSIVSRFIFGEQRFLFTGDVTKIAEQKLVDQGIYLDSHVLKVPHHGSKTSSSESFLAAVSPSLAVIQVGADNRYGHPAKEVLDRFAAFGISVLRSDLQGDIIITYDPSKGRTHIRHD